MAIAFDAATSGITGGAATSLTFSHTCSSGANRILIVGAYTHNNSSDLVTGITYGGVSMTRINVETTPGGTNAPNGMYLYYLVAPATGANDVVISSSESVIIVGVAGSYTGAKQSGQPDAENSQISTSVSNLTVNVTTVADNSWVVGIARNGNGASHINGATVRIDSDTEDGLYFVEDSDNPITPAGTGGFQLVSDSGTSDEGICIASLAPVSEAVSTFKPRVIFFN